LQLIFSVDTVIQLRKQFFASIILFSANNFHSTTLNLKYGQLYVLWRIWWRGNADHLFKNERLCSTKTVQTQAL